MYSFIVLKIMFAFYAYIVITKIPIHSSMFLDLFSIKLNSYDSYFKDNEVNGRYHLQGRTL